MSKKILVISSSPRKGGNSDTLADWFIQGARSAGNQVEKINLADLSLNFCRGCMACHKIGHCVIGDDANAVAEKMGQADVLVFATPVYYYGMSGQMKTMLDRANPLYSSPYRFRDIYLLACAAEDEENTAEGTIHGVQGWIDCFEKARLAGVFFAGGVNAPGEIQGHPALQEALERGRSIS